MGVEWIERPATPHRRIPSTANSKAVLVPGVKGALAGYSTLYFPHLPVMKSCVPYFLSLFQAAQSLYGYRNKWKYHYALSLGLVLFSLPAATIAFEASYSETTQCSPFSATWTWSDTEPSPPFFLLILPFGAHPTIIELPNSSYNVTTKTGNFRIDKLAMESGTKFIISMLYGTGRSFSRPIQFKALT